MLQPKSDKQIELEAHRAARFDGSVRLKRHKVVHRQISVSVHENLRAGLGRHKARGNNAALLSIDTRD